MKKAIIPAYLLTALLIGGASAAGFAFNLILQFGGLALVVWAMWPRSHSSVDGPQSLPLVFAGIAFGLVLVQLVPLPPEIWRALPGRSVVAAELSSIGIALGWMPLSLDPGATVASWIWTLPAVGLMLSMIVVSSYSAKAIGYVIVGVATASVILGTVQIAGGVESPAYLYEVTNRGIAVGFFANANHQATLLLVSLPFVAALYSEAVAKGKRKEKATASMLAATAVVLVLVGLLTNGSMAGLGLMTPVAVASLAAIGWKFVPRTPRGYAAITLAVALSASLVALGPVIKNAIGADAENSAISRIEVVKNTSRALVDTAPFGTGLGTFVPYYKRIEDHSDIDRFYMNNAHDDYLQIALELGIPGMLLVLAVILWIGMRTLKIWRSSETDRFARAASIAALTICAHSLVDYPLRTAAIGCVFAACFAMMAGKPRRVRSRSSVDRGGEGVHLTA